MGTWTGLGGKVDNSSKTDVTKGEPSRQGITRMGTWNFGKNAPNAEDKATEEDDDRRIRFTIGGAGRRLTKEDFLKEIQGLDPKARCEIVEESDAPRVMKDLAKRDANDKIQGSSRLFEAQDAQLAAGAQTARVIGKQMAKSQGAKIDMQGQGSKTAAGSSNSDVPESAAERRRREGALKGVDKDEEDDDRGRGRGRGRSPRDNGNDVQEERETPAEKRRREAALGEGVQSDSDDDDTLRMPPPAARSRGIRFAQSPVRGKR